MMRKALTCGGLLVLGLGCAVRVPVGSDGPDGGVGMGMDDAGATDALQVFDDSIPEQKGCFIYAGEMKTCVQAANGTVRCWGVHPDGTYGTQPFDLTFPGRVTKMSIGEAGWWAILDDGTVWFADGWTYKTVTQWLPAGSNVVDISLGDGHGCFIKNGGSLYCWGRNDYGSVGNGTTTDVPPSTPAAITVQGVSFASVVTSHLVTCALSTQGAAYCWGRNSFGQVGNGQSDPNNGVLVPTLVKGLSTGVKQIVTGTSHVCALHMDGSVYCWGLNETGQIGSLTSPDSCPWTPTPYPCAKTPQKVASIAQLKAIEIAAGSDHTCARGADHTLWCWGNGSWGQIGNGMQPSKATPTQIGVLGMQTAVGVTGGSATHTCARTFDGKLYCWGSNIRGEVGAASSGTCHDYYGGLSGACALSPILIGSITCMPPPGIN
jgi:alpha-tubulin suppressor-like RCC1 family protein